MNTQKFIIWDNEKNCWFKPTYPKNKVKNTEEIFFSQSGEMYLRENDGVDPCDKLTHIPDKGGRFTSCLYTGVKDANDIKTYQHDVVRTEDGIGKVVFQAGCFMISPIEGEAVATELLSMERSLWKKRKYERIGNLIERPDLLNQL